MNFTIYRHTYNQVGDRNVIGDFHSENGFECFTLEDEKKADGVKIYGETCIPPGTYNYEVTFSPKFKRKMILIKDVLGFRGIRIHGGNTSKDTLGCPLVGFHTDYKKIWQTAEKHITKLAIDGGGKGKITIKDVFLSYDKINKKLR
jgi:hypothetical protein